MTIQAPPVKPPPPGQRSLRNVAPNAWRRNLISRAMTVVLFGTVIAAVTPLVMVLWQVTAKGAPALSLDFFTQTEPLSYRERGGGYLAGIVGTLYMPA
jgi:phosphate transport system permease protein